MTIIFNNFVSSMLTWGVLGLSDINEVVLDSSSSILMTSVKMKNCKAEHMHHVRTLL